MLGIVQLTSLREGPAQLHPLVGSYWIIRDRTTTEFNPGFVTAQHLRQRAG